MIAALCLISVFFTVSVESGCSPWACPSLPCRQPVKLPGECCPKCPCGDNYYSVGDLVRSPDRCVTCECTKYGIMCLPWPCHPVNCARPVIRPGGCCKECGCVQRGKFYQFGYKIYSRDPCEDCRCDTDGEVTCSVESCPPLDCQQPYSEPGICCKKCGCRAPGGLTFDFGLLPDADLCSPCTCQLNGTITCESPVCPEITCSNRAQYTVDGECCPRCQCSFQNEMYRQGDVMPIPPRDSCAINCSCGTDGETVCTYPICPELDCLNPVTLPGECCPKCGCLDKRNNLLEFGPILDDPCQPCMCNLDGNVTCSERQSCPPLKCVSGTYKPNATEEQVCCPKCRCKFARNVYRPGELFQGPKCQTCECQQFTGRVSCQDADCSGTKLQCANPSIQKGECCPSCPDGATCMYKNNAISYGHYKEFGNQVCTCAGDPWFPNAFCAPKSLPADMEKTFDKRWKKYGYVAEKGKGP